MNVMIFGGTGFIGRSLTNELLDHGYQVILATRNRKNIPSDMNKLVHIVEWDYNTPLSLPNDRKNIDIIINLTGESIGKRRWTSSVKAEILESRVRSTRAIVSTINGGIIQPRVYINASAVGYYGPRNNEEITEVDQSGDDFLAYVCRRWEDEVYKVNNSQTRVLTIRIGVVLGNEGALSRMVLPFKFYLGGPLGNGRQWLSWIHIQDLVRMFRFAIEHEELTGPINGTAPNPARMKDFCKVLGEVLGRPSWFPVPKILLKIALGQMSEMVLHGQKVLPEKLLNAGFEFQFPEISHALVDVLKCK